MSQRLKKLASRARLPSFLREQQPTDARNITPPNPVTDLDPFTTPPLQTTQTGLDETPLDAIVTTPSTAPPTDPSRVKRIIAALRGQGKSSETPLKHIHQQGITGCDLTLPYFDGSSQNPDDHFIDLDTGSMEREPDVRVYFWMVGSEVLNMSDAPVDRVAHDSHLVRTGREFLLDYRNKGYGMFLSSKDRRNELNLEPGGPWYRMPTTAICEGIAKGTIAALENECAFYDPEPTQEYTYTGGRTICLVPTNIRVPLWWAESLKDGVIPGTQGWDEAIERAYTESRHPGYAIYDNIVPRDEMILNLVRMGSAKESHDTDPTDRQKADRVLLRDWPLLRLPYRRSQDFFLEEGDLAMGGITVTRWLGPERSDEEYVEPDYLKTQGITVDQFLGRPQ